MQESPWHTALTRMQICVHLSSTLHCINSRVHEHSCPRTPQPSEDTHAEGGRHSAHDVVATHGTQRQPEGLTAVTPCPAPEREVRLLPQS
jgi:hypothetical protein